MRFKVTRTPRIWTGQERADQARVALEDDRRVVAEPEILARIAVRRRPLMWLFEALSGDVSASSSLGCDPSTLPTRLGNHC